MIDAATDASVESDGGDAGAITDAGPDVDKSSPCLEDASAFGTALTNAFGRLDGTVVAVVPPGDEACAIPNSTHLVIQVLMQGAVYRMVVDVLSDVAPPDVLFYETDAPLVGGAWSEGWNTGIALDYVTTMNLHSTMFTSMAEGDVVAKITSELTLGAHVSVFATSTGEPDGGGEPNSAHLVHRNLTNQDGAIVVNPETAPHYLLIRFNEQTF